MIFVCDFFFLLYPILESLFNLFMKSHKLSLQASGGVVLFLLCFITRKKLIQNFTEIN